MDTDTDTDTQTKTDTSTEKTDLSHIKLNLPRKRTPTLLQMEAVECGAAALGIVMGYYKRVVPLEQLRIDCGVSRDGSSADNVLKAAENYGFEADAYSQELEDLQEFKVPFIVFWQFNHFLVVEGIKGNKVYLNDPASGPRTVSLEEFDRGFTGVVLEVSPGKDFKPGGAPPSLFAALKKRFAGHYLPVLFLFLIGLVLVVPGLLIPVFSKIFVDNYLVEKQVSWVFPLLIGMGITAVINFIMGYVQSYYLVRLSVKLAVMSSSKFFWHVLRLPINFYAQRSVGDISNRVDLNDNVADFIASEFAGTLLNVVVIVFYLALMFYYDAVLTMVGVTIAALNLILIRYVARIRVDKSQQLISEDSKKAGASVNGIVAIESLKSSSRESDFFTKWSGYQANVLNAIQDLGRSSFYLDLIPTMLNQLNTAIILTLGGIRIIDGLMTVGMLVAFQSLMASFIGPVNELVSVSGNFQELHGDMSRLDDVMKYEEAPELQAEEAREKVREQADAEASTEAPMHKLTGSLELRDVTFGYSRLDEPLLVDFNLKLKPGARVALVGPSGSGKSTVSKLIMGLYEPWSGEILLDGKLRQEVPRHILVSSLAMVDQEIFIFEDTIKNNITMLDNNIHEDDVIRAAEDACIHDAITARQGGYSDIVEEGGRNFSGGQRQRLEIARALVTHPRILVLDEATNSLDPITEVKIDDNVRKRGCTTVIVAHRLSTIRDCDEIIVLDRGKVVQRGTHDELKDEPGTYARLIKMA